MAELVGTRLAAFIAATSAMPWKPGTVDCCIVLADWAIWLGHPDPATHLRGTYDSEDGFRDIIAAAGGAVPIVQRCIDNIGGTRMARPVAGGVGVVGSARNIDRQWGAIFDGERWRVRARAGVITISAPTLATWEI